MIRTFADKRTRQLFEGLRVPAFEAIADKARRRLNDLAVAQTLRELQARPGNCFAGLR
jgi:plasmid maintenance system killer protein